MTRWLDAIFGWIKRLFRMRRKISLYIADQLVDLDDQSFVLMNYTMDDLSNPTIVRNSYSQQITLKGTPANNKVFGSAFRADRKVSYGGGEYGVDFDPSRKTPFVVYDEMSEILESGYVKLDSVSRQGADIQYKVTLYGGLGSFFYALSYDDDGNRRTLADLSYLGTSNPETELDFVINATSVQDAWDRLDEDAGAVEQIWDVINFAPAYNGIPDGNFDPDKALVDPLEVGLQDSIIDDGGVTYDTTKGGGLALVNLSEPQDEWAVKDLRSYLQRPVFSMKAFWAAICDPENNGGFTVDASVLDDYATFGRYEAMWMTLPLISSIGTIKQSSGDLSLTMSSTASSGNFVGRYDVSGSVPSGTEVTANLNLRLRFNVTGADSYATLDRAASQADGRTTTTKMSVLFIQAVAHAADDTIVGGSAVKVVGATRSPSSLARECGYTAPFPEAGYEALTVTEFEKVSSGIFEIPLELGFMVEAQDVAYYKIMVSAYTGTETRIESGGSGRRTTTTYTYVGGSTPVMYVDYDTHFTPASTYIVDGATTNTVTYVSSESLRSGAAITKRMLLSTSHTPAEYMLSFAKMFGLYFDYDVATRKVTVLRRNDLYLDETVDLTGRVDLTKGVSIKPLVFDRKWYDFILEGAGGAFYDEYMDVEGIEYGMRRVNTGYDFNADSLNLMDSVVYRNACTILGRSKYFNYIFKTVGGDTFFQPSPFLDSGNTYTLWSTDGETLETDISCPPDNASLTYYNGNADWEGYDVDTARKLELRDKENKPVDGADILVFHEGWDIYDYFKLTDDVPAMDLVNDGVPCWLLGAGDSGDDALRIPTFQRYVYGTSYTVKDSLDFGIPRQLDIPGLTYPDGTTIYERAWKAYLSDRYDVNTKVITCRVNFRGMQVTRQLLRKFYWYDNSLWVLNAIKNYSLTTWDTVECEFVQVQDKSNYLTGQSY